MIGKVPVHLRYYFVLLCCNGMRFHDLSQTLKLSHFLLKRNEIYTIHFGHSEIEKQHTSKSLTKFVTETFPFNWQNANMSWIAMRL